MWNLLKNLCRKIFSERKQRVFLIVSYFFGKKAPNTTPYHKNGWIGIAPFWSKSDIPDLDELFKEGITMFALGEYVADATEGITHPDDLPKPKNKKLS